MEAVLGGNVFALESDFFGADFMAPQEANKRASRLISRIFFFMTYTFTIILLVDVAEFLPITRFAFVTDPILHDRLLFARWFGFCCSTS